MIRSVTRPLSVVALSMLLVAGLVSSAGAEDKDQLRERRDELSNQISGQEADVIESTQRFREASAALESANAELAAAEANLNQVRGELAVAQAEDERLRAELAAAEAELAAAEERLNEAEAELAESEAQVEQFAVDSIIQGDPRLRAFGDLLRGMEPNEFSEQISINNSITDAQIATMQTLEASRVLLEVQRKELQELRDRVAEQKAAAEANVLRMQALTAEAEAVAAEVSDLVSIRAEAQAEADAARAEDEALLAELEAERARTAAQLQAIIEEELRQAAEAERRRQEEERRLAEERRRQQQSSGGSSSGSSGSSSGGGSTSTPPASSGAFQRPVGGRTTSPFGMRRHPITGVYKLHDGTDFSGACGTPIYAAEAGTIVQQYYNAGYGNRVIINHGVRDGASIMTTYNHLSRYALSSGSRVARGQVIGYVGTTGLSTGCHLHFMVLRNGSPVNPMGYL